MDNLKRYFAMAVGILSRAPILTRDIVRLAAKPEAGEEERSEEMASISSRRYGTVFVPSDFNVSFDDATPSEDQTGDQSLYDDDDNREIEQETQDIKIDIGLTNRNIVEYAIKNKIIICPNLLSQMHGEINKLLWNNPGNISFLDFLEQHPKSHNILIGIITNVTCLGKVCGRYESCRKSYKDSEHFHGIHGITLTGQIAKDERKRSEELDSSNIRTIRVKDKAEEPT